jgi:hypothetical protein
LYFWASLKAFTSMALLKIMTTINPSTAASVAGGSAYFVYNTDQINFLTLASRTGSGGSAFSTFNYELNGGGIGKATVKASTGAVLAPLGASAVG